MRDTQTINNSAWAFSAMPCSALSLDIEMESGFFWVKCPKGLWAVSGPDYEDVMTHAISYVKQYAEEGEYRKQNQSDKGA